VNNVYSCLPHFDAAGQAVGGYEFTITVRGSIVGDSSLKKVEGVVMDAFQQAANFVFDTFQA
jgi:hypothetical protein